MQPVKGNLERSVHEKKPAVKWQTFTTTVCHSSLSPNHSFIMSAERKRMGVSSGCGANFRAAAGGLCEDLHRSGHRDTWRPLVATSGRGGSEGVKGRLMAHLHSCQITHQLAPGTESILFPATINLGPVGFIPPLSGPGLCNLCLIQLPNQLVGSTFVLFTERPSSQQHSKQKTDSNMGLSWAPSCHQIRRCCRSGCDQNKKLSHHMGRSLNRPNNNIWKIYCIPVVLETLGVDKCM